MAKKKMKRSSKINANKTKRMLMGGLIVIIVVVVLYYLLATESTEDETSIDDVTQVDLANNLPVVTGQSYFGYMKDGYVLHVNVNGEDKRIEIKSLNEDYTVDLVMNRAYNVEIGETILADYNYDGAADVGFTLEGVDYYNHRFSATITYFGELPETVTQE